MKKILLLNIVILALSLRFFHLATVPIGFIPEEVSTGWNAYSLLKTGRDEWGTLLPIVFRETGGFKLTLNSYLIVPIMAILGPTEFAVRGTTAFAGVLAVLLTYFVTRVLFGNKKIAFLAAFFLAISPWHISMSRYGVDVNWGVPLFLAGLFFFLKSEKKPFFLIPSAFFFSFTYHTYFNYIVFTFLFVIGLLFLRWKNGIRALREGKFLFLFFFTQIIFLLPYLLQQNLTIRFSQATSISKIGQLNRIHEHREACSATYPLPLCRLLYNKPVETVQEITRNAINHFSTTTFFLYGSERGLSGMPRQWGFLYFIEFPLLLSGIVYSIRKGLVSSELILWAVLWALPSALAGDAHVWRMMTVIPLPQILTAAGLVWIWQRMKRVSFLLIATSLVSLSFLHFLVDYFGYFPYAQGQYSYYGFKNLYSYLSTIEKDYDAIVIAPLGMGFNQLYIYYVFYNRYNPDSYQKGIDVDRRVGEQNWVWVDRIGKWYFVGEADKVKYPLNERTLVVIDSSRSDPLMYDPTLTLNTIHTISYPNGDPAFRISQVISKPPSVVQ